MRKPSPAYLATSVAIALTASVAFAQTSAPPARVTPTITMVGPAAPASTSSSNPSANAQPGRMANNGSTSGSANGSTTSATPTTTLGNPTVLSNADGSRTSTTLNADGTRTIVTTKPDGTTTKTVLPENLFNPNIVNGVVGGVTPEGERLLDEREQALLIDRSAVSIDLQSQGAASADVRRNSVSLDRAINAAAKERKKIGRNGQLLNTIAPRTNVDRSHEMPDDGPTPALSGLSNGLSRR